MNWQPADAYMKLIIVKGTRLAQFGQLLLLGAIFFTQMFFHPPLKQNVAPLEIGIRSYTNSEFDRCHPK